MLSWGGFKSPSACVAVPKEGLECASCAGFAANTADLRADDAPRVDVSARESVAFGPEKATLEDALARALAAAAAAAQWDVVAALARELEARRLASAGAVDLASARVRRERLP